MCAVSQLDAGEDIRKVAGGRLRWPKMADFSESLSERIHDGLEHLKSFWLDDTHAFAG